MSEPAPEPAPEPTTSWKLNIWADGYVTKAQPEDQPEDEDEE